MRKVIQYIPRNMHTVFALLCFVVVIHWLIFPYPSGLLHWHCGNLTIAPVPAKQPWWIWINTSCEFIMNDCITTTKQSTTKPHICWDILYTRFGPNWCQTSSIRQPGPTLQGHVQSDHYPLCFDTTCPKPHKPSNVIQFRKWFNLYFTSSQNVLLVWLTAQPQVMWSLWWMCIITL